MEKNQIIDKTAFIYKRFYRKIFWLMFKCIGLVVFILFLIQGFRVDSTSTITLSFLCTGMFLYLVLLSFGMDLSGDPEDTPWQERNKALELLRRA